MLICFYRRPLKAKDILILCCGIIGVYFVFLPGISIESDILGLFLLLLSAISWAVSNILVKKYFVKHNKFVLTTWQMLFGSVGLVVLSFWFENPTGLSLNYIYPIDFKMHRDGKGANPREHRELCDRGE